MSTDLMIIEELKKYPVSQKIIDDLREKCMGLTISGIDDKVGYATVHTARMEIKNNRVAVEKTRKLLKEDSLKFGRAVDAEAKRLTDLLLEIEQPLEQLEGAIDAEKERIKQEKIRQEQAKLQKRFDRLRRYKPSIELELIRLLKDDEFEAYLQKCKTEYEAEQARLAEQKRLADIESARIAERKEREAIESKQTEERRIESERLAKVAAEQAAERKRLDAIAEEQRKKEDALKVERARIDAEKRNSDAIKEQKEIKPAVISKPETTEQSPNRLKDKIFELLEYSFASVYCNTCAHKNDQNCDECHRKAMMWSISSERADEIANKILLLVEADK